MVYHSVAVLRQLGTTQKQLLTEQIRFETSVILEMEQSFSAKPPQRTVRAPLKAYGSPKLNISLYFYDLLFIYNVISAKKRIVNDLMFYDTMSGLKLNCFRN